MNKAIKLGLDWEKEWLQALKDKGYWAKKIQDTRTMQAYSPIMIIDKVPCDIISIHNGITSYWECKTTQRTALPLLNIKEHQLTDMVEIEQRGAPAWFVIRFYKRDSYAREPIRNRHYVVKPSQLQTLINRAKCLGRASIPEAWFKE